MILNSDTVEPEVKPNVGKTPPKIKQIKEKGKEKEKTRVRTIIVKQVNRGEKVIYFAD